MPDDQLTLTLDAGDLCRYGLPLSGARRACSRPATHAAVWRKDGATGRVECCLTHANYYATAWCDWWWLPNSTATVWMEVLPCPT